MSKVVWQLLCDYTSVVVAWCLNWSGRDCDYTSVVVAWCLKWSGRDCVIMLVWWLLGVESGLAETV